jgi:hypothetical protein
MRSGALQNIQRFSSALNSMPFAPVERIKFARKVADPIPKRALQRAAELLTDTLDLDQDLLVRGRGGGEWRVAGGWF